MNLDWLRVMVASHLVLPVMLNSAPLTPVQVNIPKNIQIQDLLDNDSLPLDYLPEVRRKIKQLWAPSKGLEEKRVVVAFKITKQGLLSNLKLVSASGAPLADNAALEAIQKAAPFAPLPSDLNEIYIQIIFDWSLWKEKENER